VGGVDRAMMGCAVGQKRGWGIVGVSEMDVKRALECTVTTNSVPTGRGSGRRHDLTEQLKTQIATRAARLRVLSYTWKQCHAKIQEEFPEANVSESSIIKWVNEHIKPAAEIAVEDYRQQQLAQIELAKRAIMPRVQKGDDKAIASLNALMNREAKLLGMDAPVQVQLETKQVNDELEVQRMLAGFMGHVIPGEVVKPAELESGE